MPASTTRQPRPDPSRRGRRPWRRTGPERRRPGRRPPWRRPPAESRPPPRTARPGSPAPSGRSRSDRASVTSRKIGTPASRATCLDPLGQQPLAARDDHRRRVPVAVVAKRDRDVIGIDHDEVRFSDLGDHPLLRELAVQPLPLGAVARIPLRLLVFALDLLARHPQPAQVPAPHQQVVGHPQRQRHQRDPLRQLRGHAPERPRQPRRRAPPPATPGPPATAARSARPAPPPAPP